MLKFIVPCGAAAAALLVGVAPAAAQSTLGPTPREQAGMHTGDANTNGSAVIVTDRNGTHPEGYVGMAPRNRIAGTGGPATHHRHHHRHHHSATEPAAR